jgi:hypothetical protein
MSVFNRRGATAAIEARRHGVALCLLVKSARRVRRTRINTEMRRARRRAEVLLRSMMDVDAVGFPVACTPVTALRAAMDREAPQSQARSLRWRACDCGASRSIAPAKAGVTGVLSVRHRVLRGSVLDPCAPSAPALGIRCIQSRDVMAKVDANQGELDVLICKTRLRPRAMLACAITR